MATIRFSDKLCDDIRHNAQRIFLTREERLCPPEWSEKFRPVVDHYTQTIAGYRGNIPDEFFTMRSSVHVTVFSVDDYRIGTQTRTIDLADGIIVPANPIAGDTPLLTELGAVSLRTDYSRLSIQLDDASPRWAVLTQEVAAMNARLVELRREGEVFIEGVDKVIKRHTTLAPALKIWPPLWDLLPNETKERHKQITEKRKSPKQVVEELEVDLDAMTGITVAAKLTQ